MAELLNIQICYATDRREELRDLQVLPGTTIEQALRQSGILIEIPEIDLDHNPVGLWSKKKPLDTLLREHDRIEIYRPLIADPMESRRRRAAKKA